MKKTIDLEALFSPVPGEIPGGEDLRYTAVYDDLKEARRADDMLERGDWQRQIKTSDWGRVAAIAVETLSKKSKDLQIAVWLTEALIHTEGFGGLAAGLKILHGFLKDYWETLYPPVEEDDLEFRAAPLQFLNDKLSPAIKEIPLTDGSAGPRYSWLQWQESREVGSEADTLGRSGNVDANRRKRREELIAEGKLSAEEFDAAAARTAKAYSQALLGDLALCRETFQELDRLTDEKFGSQAPVLSDFRTALEDCAEAAMKIYPGQKGRSEPAPSPSKGVKAPDEKTAPEESEEKRETAALLPAAGAFAGGESHEREVWEEALRSLKTSGMKESLAILLGASNCAASVRERNRYRLLMAKLCLEADRPDLARPIMEGLNRLIEELHLEAWESPLWIAEVLDALYQCLNRGEEPSDEDKSREKALLQKLCTLDVTRAMIYKP
jgi:type VI secretion system protein ImpA